MPQLRVCSNQNGVPIASCVIYIILACTSVGVILFVCFRSKAPGDSVLHYTDELGARGEAALRLLHGNLVPPHDGRQGSVEQPQKPYPGEQSHRVLVLGSTGGGEGP